MDFDYPPLHSDGISNNPAPRVPKPTVEDLEALAILKKERKDTITSLEISVEARSRLEWALNTAELWPLYFRSHSHEARKTKTTTDQWSEEDSRALLCLVRNFRRFCPKVSLDVIGRKFFPDRGPTAARFYLPRLLDTLPSSWNHGDGAMLIEEYEDIGEPYEEMACGRFVDYSALELEIALEVAYRSLRPVKNKKKSDRAVVGDQTGAREAGGEEEEEDGAEEN